MPHRHPRVCKDDRIMIPEQPKNRIWLYLISFTYNDCKYFKIGSTTRLYERISELYRELQATKLKLVCVIEPDENNNEKDIHKKLKKNDLNVKIIISGRNKREIYKNKHRTVRLFNEISGVRILTTSYFNDIVNDSDIQKSKETTTMTA